MFLLLLVGLSGIVLVGSDLVLPCLRVGTDCSAEEVETAWTTPVAPFGLTARQLQSCVLAQWFWPDCVTYTPIRQIKPCSFAFAQTQPWFREDIYSSTYFGNGCNERQFASFLRLGGNLNPAVKILPTVPTSVWSVQVTTTGGGIMVVSEATYKRNDPVVEDRIRPLVTEEFWSGMLNPPTTPTTTAAQTTTEAEDEVDEAEEEDVAPAALAPALDASIMEASGRPPINTPCVSSAPPLWSTFTRTIYIEPRAKTSTHFVTETETDTILSTVEIPKLLFKTHTESYTHTKTLTETQTQTQTKTSTHTPPPVISTETETSTHTLPPVISTTSVVRVSTVISPSPPLTPADCDKHLSSSTSALTQECPPCVDDLPTYGGKMVPTERVSGALSVFRSKSKDVFLGNPIRVSWSGDGEPADNGESDCLSALT